MRFRQPFASLARGICFRRQDHQGQAALHARLSGLRNPDRAGAGPAPTGSTTALGAARSGPVRDSRWNVPPIGVERRGRPLSGVTGRHRPWPACRHRVRHARTTGPSSVPDLAAILPQSP